MVRGALQASMLLVLAPLSPLMAQAVAGPIEPRVGKLEQEMRAVQRKIFPQGVPVAPEISTAPVPALPAGNAATTPIGDLTTRVDGVERQLGQLTGQIEQDGFRIRQLEEALAKVQARLAAIDGAAASDGSIPTAARPVPERDPTSVTAPSRQTTPMPTLTPTPSRTPTLISKPPTVSGAQSLAPAPSRPAPAKSDLARKAGVAAIEAPSTGDPIEDEYTYGFRLYSAKFLPEAQAKLKAFTTKYPATSKRWSYAQNLLGRAYYDEGKPALAAVALYENYQKAPRGERASESLYWLAQALTKLKKLPDACKVYDELNDVYGSKLTGDAKTRASRGRVDARCPS